MDLPLNYSIEHILYIFFLLTALNPFTVINQSQEYNYMLSLVSPSR